MKKYLGFLIVVTLVAVMFAGCSYGGGGGPGDGPGSGGGGMDTISNRYHPGDVVSYYPKDIGGYLIVKYDPVNELYYAQNVFNMSGKWYWLESPQIYEKRSEFESTYPSKIGFISDPSILPIEHLPTYHDSGPADGSSGGINYVETNFTNSSNRVTNRGSADGPATDGDNTRVSRRYIFDGTACIPPYGGGCGVGDGDGIETLTLNSNGSYILTSEPSYLPAYISDWKNETNMTINGVTIHFKHGFNYNFSELTISGNYSVHNNTVTINDETQFMTQFHISGNNLVRGGSGDVFVKQ